MIESSKSQSSGSAWERWSQVVGIWLPYATLAISLILSLVLTGQNWVESGGNILLAALAAIWVFVMHTGAPEPRYDHPARMVVYLAGLLALASFLMFRHLIFFVFATTGAFSWPLWPSRSPESTCMKCSSARRVH